MQDFAPWIALPPQRQSRMRRSCFGWIILRRAAARHEAHELYLSERDLTQEFRLALVPLRTLRRVPSPVRGQLRNVLLQPLADPLDPAGSAFAALRDGHRNHRN
jgi:hypothetical protein